MNRNTYMFFLKSFFALLILFISNHSFAITYTAIATGVDFKLPGSWSGNPDPSEFTNGDATFIIAGGKAIYVSSDLKIGNLYILSGSTLKVNTTTDITISITENLTINDPNTPNQSMIDFGDYNVTLIVGGSLIGNSSSVIMQHPAGGQKQELVLTGETNSLDQYTNTTNGGTSIVRYARNGDQTVFNTANYVDLYLEGSGTKILSATGTSGMEATVKNKLTLSNCKLQIGDLNFNYAGAESNLSYTNGWVYTNGTGLYKNHSSESKRTFPVGNATNMQVITLSGISIANQDFDVRFGAISPSNAIVPNNGAGVWYIASSHTSGATVTLIKPVAPAALTNASAIARYSSAWKIQTTTYTSATNSYSTFSGTLSTSGLNAFSIFTCPAFTLTPATLPDAGTGTAYSQALQINNGLGKHGIVSFSSNPSSGFTAGMTSFTGLTIAHTAPVTGSYSLSLTVRDTTQCQTTFTLPITVVLLSTTWNGTSWSNGVPSAAKDVIIAGNYSTATANIVAKTLTVNAGAVLTILAADTVKISGSLNNQGTINKACIGTLTYTSPLVGNPVNTPAILPDQLTPGIEGQNYSQQFTVSDNASATEFSMTGAPANFGLNGGLLVGAAEDAVAGVYSIKVTYSKNSCTLAKSYTLKITDLPSPNLAIVNIPTKTFGDTDFTVNTYSRSTGTVTYALAPNSGTCASINAVTGVVSISCAGQVTIQASQTATAFYKAEATTKSFIITPANGKMQILKYAFLTGENKPMNVSSTLPAPVFTYDQLTGFDKAVVESSGLVKTTNTGTFTVRISLAASANYSAFDSVYVFDVVAAPKPPVAVADTIVLEMGNDSIINILTNDKGMTEVIMPNKTDIDIENSGVQIKFYATELGNFLIDPNGNLTIKPFYGFIGSNRLGYTVTDANGLTSDIGYVYVTVKPPFVIPELKANEVMSPNNDHLNDALVVANTDLNKENSLMVLDEAGNTVFEQTNYQNDWEGVDRNNNKLEAGVYFYVFKEKNTGRQLSQFIQIVVQ